MHLVSKKRNLFTDEQYSLQDIRTENDEINFQKLLGQKQTFFLNGAWGSGKSTFIEKVAGNKYKTKYLNLWELDSKYSIFSLAFKVLYPWFYLCVRVLITLLFTFSVIGLPLLQWGLRNKIYWWIMGIIIFSTVLVSVGKLMEVNTNYFDKKFLLLNSSLFKNNVLVIDDFDRLSTVQQKSIYKLLNFLHNKMDIVILGEYAALKLTKQTFFLHKIIDKRVELPFSLKPTNIWFDYFDDLSNELKVQIPSLLIRMFVFEDRNLRDRERFNSLVIQEFKDNKKLNHVIVEQQLIVMYLYLYYFDIYQQLVYKNDKIIVEDNFYLENLINLLLEDKSKSYPVSFTVNRLNYMIFAIPTSLTIYAIEEILSDTDKLETELKKEDNQSFIDFVSVRYDALPQESKTQILKTTLITIQKMIATPSDTIKRVITLEVQGDIQSGYMGRSFERWSKLLDSLHFSISEKIRFLTFNRIISYKALGEEYLPQILKKSSFTEVWNSQKSTAFPEAIILCYVSYANIWGEFDKWSEEIWNSVENLKKENFLYFCRMQNLSSEMTKPNFALAKKTPSVEDPFEWQHNEIFLEKMKSKITEFGISIVDN